MRGMDMGRLVAGSMASLLGMNAAESLRPGRYRPMRLLTLHTPNGKRECARRRRQIAAGSLRVANGVVA